MAKPGDVIENPAFGDRIVFHRTREETNGEVLKFDLYAQPNAEGPPPHIHPRSDEHFEVITGRLQANVDGTPMSFAEGEKFTVPAGVAHTWWNEGEEEAQVRITFVPEGGMESFLETLYGLAQDGKTNDKGIPNPLQLAVTASAYFETNHLAKPPLAMQKAVFGLLAPIGRLLGYQADYPYPYRRNMDGA